MASQYDPPVSSCDGRDWDTRRRDIAAGVAALSAAIPCRSSVVLELLVSNRLVRLSDVIYIQTTIITDYPDVRP